MTPYEQASTWRQWEEDRAKDTVKDIQRLIITHLNFCSTSKLGS